MTVLVQPGHVCRTVCEWECTEGLTTKLVPKLVNVQTAIAWPLTLRGKISPIMSQEMGPKLICNTNDVHQPHDLCCSSGVESQQSPAGYLVMQHIEG